MKKQDYSIDAGTEVKEYDPSWTVKKFKIEMMKGIKKQNRKDEKENRRMIKTGSAYK